MKKLIMAGLALGICMMLAACGENSTDPNTTDTVTTFGPTVSTATTVGSTPPTDPTPPVTGPTTLPTTGPVVEVSGWQQQGDRWYYYDESGNMAAGFTQIFDSMYYFGVDGAMHTGWLELFGELYYFSPGGVMQQGWISVEGNRYYMDQDGALHTGWLDLDRKRYYLGEDGTVYTGWLQLDGELYYLQPNGVMAKGMVEIDGQKNYFTSTGAYIILVNPWNYIPEGYEPNLVTMEKHKYNVQKVDAICYDELIQMLDDCKAESQTAVVISSYRSMEGQTNNYNRKVNSYLNQGYAREEAERLAALSVARPGTSEHQLGLAVDIVDNKNWSLDETQATMPAQKWLMENSWKYGFILRYPVGKTDVTGIIYEPWHYRYVGKTLAKELHELDLTLEEYLDKLTKEANT